MSSLGEDYSRSVLVGSFLARVGVAILLSAVVVFVRSKPTPLVPLITPFFAYAVLDALWPKLDRTGRFVGGAVSLLVLGMITVQYQTFAAFGFLIATSLIILFGIAPLEPITAGVANRLPGVGASSEAFEQPDDDSSPRTLTYTPRRQGADNDAGHNADEIACPDCGLSLERHLVGEFCPQCGRPVTDVLPTTHHQLVGKDNDRDT